jgi:hypothetical protein
MKYQLAYINGDDYRFNFIQPNYLIKEFNGGLDLFIKNQSKKAPFQIGETFLATKIDKRYLELEVWVSATSVENLYERKMLISKIFSPEKGMGKLEFISPGGVKYYIDCKLAEMEFVRGLGRGETFQLMIMYLECFKPYWYKEISEDIYFYGYTGGFSLPLSFPWTFGTKGTTVTIRNEGNVINTPIEIFMEGEVVEPVIENVTTGEKIEVVTTIADGEELYIDTGIINKRVLIDGVNAFHYISPLSDFWGLVEGDNVIRYTSVSENANASCRLKYREYFVGAGQ